MSAVGLYFGDTSPWVAAAFGVVGTVIGGVIAATVSLRLARDAREAAERAWVRDSRRQIYDRYLIAGQRLLAVMEKAASRVPTKPEAEVEESYSAFFGAYASVQTVAELGVVANARIHAYRLQALKDILDGRGPFEHRDFNRIAKLVRDARHDTIDAMRADLGLPGDAKPPTGDDYARAVADAAREDPSQSVVP
jgi:hypothetical protein